MTNPNHKSWFYTILEIDKLFISRKTGIGFHPLDDPLHEQVKTVIQLFNECRFVGFNYTDQQAEAIISKVMIKVQSSLNDKLAFVPEHPFFNLYLGFCYLEKALQLIKKEYEKNIPNSLKHLEEAIYQNTDFQNLIEVSRIIGRKLINKELHPDFKSIKKHINEQLEFLKQELEYQTSFKDIDSWVEWFCRNPKLAEKYYPEITTGVHQKIIQTPPFVRALIIQKLPEHFTKWKSEADRLFGEARQKKIGEYITLLHRVLNEYEYPTEIEIEAVNSVRDELSEQLNYWQNDLRNPTPQLISKSNGTKTLITSKIEEMDNLGWEYAFNSVSDYNIFTDLLTNFFEYKPYNLPKKVIRLKRTCKTKLAKILGEIHKELSEKPLKSDYEYFKIIKSLSHFQNETDLYKALTR